MTGTVKWFSAGKGYGFITRGDTGEDVFVHYSEIEGKGYKTLNEGDKVEFEVETTNRGVKALAVKITQPAQPQR